LKAALASAVMAWAAVKTVTALAALELPGLMGELLTVVGAGGAGFLVYGGVVWLLRVDEVRLVREVIRDSMRRVFPQKSM
jgi:hypothetical protein